MWIRSRSIVIIYKPNTPDMTQHPLLLNSLLFTPAFAAADAPPERQLYNENSPLSMPTAVTTARKSSLSLVYHSGRFFFLSVLCWWFSWLVTDLNMNSSEFSFIFAMLDIFITSLLDTILNFPLLYN